MITGGVGGANTNKTGLQFEIETDLQTNLQNAKIDISKITFCRKRNLETLLKKHNFDMTEYFGKRFEPDEAFIYNNELFVIEKKYQGGSGSVDEKIQTGPYKKLVYEICANALGLTKATYIYLLKGKFFNTNKYTKHQIPYLEENGIPVYFDSFPIEKYFN